MLPADVDRPTHAADINAENRGLLEVSNFALGDGTRLIASSGNDMGVQSSMFLLPESSLGAVVLTNSSGYQSDKLAIMALEAAAPGTLEKFMAVASAFEARSAPFSPSAPWLGAWAGAIDDGATKIPVGLSIAGSGLLISLGDAAPVALEEATLRDGMLSGAFTGTLSLYEKPDGPHRIEINLIADRGRLVGFALANFRTDRGKFEVPTPMALSRTD
ncbi:MAG: hypothetical protein HXY21_13295 [Parvularculaceae bacterium]|nr:hypothetical protein [Parvularculaceae bacterium]